MSGLASRPLAAETEIEVGVHHTVEFLGITFNYDTILSTVLAGVIVLGLGLYMARRVSNRVPSRLQLAFETVTDAVQKQVDSTIGPTAPFVVPLAVTLFFFILLANWIELVPTEHALPSPTADTNLTYAMAFFVVVWVHVAAVKQKGFRTYAKHYAQPYAVLVPLNILEELAKPFTLALRLFGNIFAGGIMIALIGLIPAWLSWLPHGLWRGFDLLIGVIQAFIFALLTILYFSFALQDEH
ncbi:MAG: F0F1 ATP synthase subunit A [Actinomycetes bacterium]